MGTGKWFVDAKPLAEDGWHLVKTGKSNVFLASMSLADVHTVDAVEVVHGWWIELPGMEPDYGCSECGRRWLWYFSLAYVFFVKCLADNEVKRGEKNERLF